MALCIALLTYSTKPRGSVIHTVELAEALSQIGHQPRVFALDKDGQGLYRSVDFPVYYIPTTPCEGDIDQLIKQRIGEFVYFFECHAQRYDIYHAQDCLGANALALLKEQGRIPHFVRTVHHIENFRSPYLQACQEKSIYQADRCLCVSAVWQQVLKTDYGIDAHRVINGVSQRFSAQKDGSEVLLTEHYAIEGCPVYLTVGGIEPRKNSINLLKAFAQVRSQQPTAQLIIAGGATLFDYQDYRKQFMSWVQHYALEKALCLLGVVSDENLPRLYRLADAFIFPSLREGWGLVVLEAIASGLPILTSNRAPFTEFLASQDAYWVNPNDVDAIATGMLTLTESHNPVLIDRETLINCYNWQTSAQMHLELYHQFIPASL